MLSPRQFREPRNCGVRSEALCARSADRNNRIEPASIVAVLPGPPQSALDPHHNLNRPGLLLQNDVLYLAFGSHDDLEPYSGWILAYDAKTLKLLAAYNTAAEWGEGGIWQSGTGLAGDGEHIYAVVGDGADTDKRPLPNNVAAPSTAIPSSS